jgi:hypothetical protein
VDGIYRPLQWEKLASCCEDSREPSCSIKYCKLLEKLRNYDLLKKHAGYEVSYIVIGHFLLNLSAVAILNQTYPL